MDSEENSGDDGSRARQGRSRQEGNRASQWQSFISTALDLESVEIPETVASIE